MNPQVGARCWKWPVAQFHPPPCHGQSPRSARRPLTPRFLFLGQASRLRCRGGQCDRCSRRYRRQSGLAHTFGVIGADSYLASGRLCLLSATPTGLIFPAVDRGFCHGYATWLRLVSEDRTVERRRSTCAVGSHTLVVWRRPRRATVPLPRPAQSAVYEDCHP